MLSLYISKSISTIYNQTYIRLQQELERVNYLEKFENISDIVKMLNHEIKKPLAPLEIWTTNLVSASESGDASLIETSKNIIAEEINNLKSHVKYFNSFGSLPEPHFKTTNVNKFTQELIHKFSELYSNVKFSYVENDLGVKIKIDRGLISQVFQNLIDNALEANPNIENLEVKFNVLTTDKEGSVSVLVINEGKHLDNIKDIFKLRVTSSSEKSFKGYGLTIAKATMIKHGGDLTAEEYKSGASFAVTFPILKDT